MAEQPLMFYQSKEEKLIPCAKSAKLSHHSEIEESKEEID
jgi:hypothetical protein